jgi:hypothetical protein
MVSFRPHPLYSRGKIPRYRLNRRLGGPQCRSELSGKEIHQAPHRDSSRCLSVAHPPTLSLYRLRLTFMGPCIVISSYITNKMQRYTIFFFPVNALHVSGGFSAYHQELKNCTHSIGYMSSLLAATPA